MLKRSVRRSGSRRAEEGESGYDDAQNASQPEGGDQTPLLLAEMARGMIDTQSKVNELSGTLNAEEITTLLRQINGQLKNLQNTQNGVQGERKSGQSVQMGQNREQGASNGAGANDLAALFGKLLNQGSSQQAGNQQNTASNGSQMQSSQPPKNNNSGTGSQGQENITQTAAQMLAQAQYELSNELDASLKKLKQVISESEKIAARISNLLGEENNPNKS